jgi:hypothetical protein
MIDLQDKHGNEARFTDRGDLAGFTSQGLRRDLGEPTPGWSLEFTQGLNRLPARPLTGSGRPTQAGPDRLEVTFKSVHAAGGPVPLEARVTWWLEDGLLHARLALAGLPAEPALHAAVIPDVAFSYEQPDATRLVVPRETGMIVEQAATALFLEKGAPGEIRVAYPGHAHMQCFGWLEGDRGLYTDARDPEGWIKEWRFFHAWPGRVGLQLRHLAPRRLEPAGAFALPYPVTLGATAGGWHGVAKTYRRWALRQPWAARGPDERRNSYFGNISTWLWNRGRIDHVAPPARELARRIGAPVGLDWYWWHRHPYDTQYPDYFPPREGEARFKAAVKELQADGVAVQVYMNGMCFDKDGALWAKDGPACALELEGGGHHAPAYNTFMEHRLADTCGGSAVWRGILLDLVARARDLGLDGLYLDMIAAVGGAHPCYNPAHGHAPGGGCYGVQGFRRLLEEARRLAPGLALSSECTLECYLDLLDGNITPGLAPERLKWLAEQHGGRSRPVPLFNAVYHGRAVCFGSYTLLDGVPPFDELWPARFRTPPEAEKDWAALCPDQFAFELARTVSFGNQPLAGNLTAEHLADPRLAGEIGFLVDVARFYHAHREWLLWGTLLPPGALECPAREIRFLQRFIFTKPGEETYLTRSHPAVLHAEWQAPDGRLGAVLFNYTREAVDVAYTPPAGYAVEGAVSGRLPARACVFWKLIRKE